MNKDLKSVQFPVNQKKIKKLIISQRFENSQIHPEYNELLETHNKLVINYNEIIDKNHKLIKLMDEYVEENEKKNKYYEDKYEDLRREYNDLVYRYNWQVS